MQAVGKAMAPAVPQTQIQLTGAGAVKTLPGERQQSRQATFGDRQQFFARTQRNRIAVHISVLASWRRITLRILTAAVGLGDRRFKLGFMQVIGPSG
ncbi:hypothetical protein D3C75_1191530 [compost metagenome]